MEFLVLVLAVGLGMAVLVPHRHVTRARLARFARRHHLPVTVDNGSVLIEYLATVARYRFAGVLTGLLADFGYAGVRGAAPFTVRLVIVLAGLLIGCAAAEFRRRAIDDVVAGASLRRRATRDYVADAVLWLAGGSGLLALGYAVFARVRATTTYTAGIGTLDALLVVALVAAAVVVVTARRIVTRPQPALAADVMAADEATRSASFSVLAGWTVAFAGVLAAAALDANPYALNADHHVLDAVVVVLAVALPLVGGAVALRGRSRTGVPGGRASAYT